MFLIVKNETSRGCTLPWFWYSDALLFTVQAKPEKTLTAGPGAPEGPWGPGAPASPFCPDSPCSPLVPG